MPTKNAAVKVLLLARYARRGASSRVRHLDLIPGLEKKGFEFDTDCLLDDDAVQRFYAGLPRRQLPIALAYLRRVEKLMMRTHRYDLIWIEKEVFPWLPWSVETLAFNRRHCATVVDFDDDWHARYMQHNSEFIRQIGSAKFPLLLKWADAVSGANPILASRLEALGNRPVEVIPNGIDLERYARAVEFRRDARQAVSVGHPASGDRVRIGWIGTPTTAKEHLAPAIPMLNRLTTDGVCDVVIVGAGNAVPDLIAERRAWSEATEVEEVARFDVGIMPLANSIFDQSKSGWKLVQCMAAGVPVVASAVGFNTDLLVDGQNGFLAADFGQFETRLVQLARDHDLRRRMGEVGRSTVQERYGMSIAVDQTAATFNRALDCCSARQRK